MLHSNTYILYRKGENKILCTTFWNAVSYCALKDWAKRKQLRLKIVTT